MANPFGKSKTFHRIGHVTNTPAWKVFPTPSGLALVTVIGRKTGKPRQRAMRVVRDGDRAYAVALLGEKSDWVRNVQAHARVRIKLGSKTHNATARILEGEGERARVAEIYRPIAGWYDYVDYANFVWSFPTRAKLLRVHDDWFETGTPVVFELQPDV
jgi:deazaflavin-dependent oxidoreductase (nitroreductase family)